MALFGDEFRFERRYDFMKESFRPKANTAPIGIAGQIVCWIRYVIDFQYHTVVKDIRTHLGKVEGVLLDVGCGDSPYRSLVNTNCKYLGIDIEDRKDQFDYPHDDKTLYFDKSGKIPLDDSSVDCILCTEVLEHVFNYARLIEEMHRVLRPNGQTVMTVPWSARYHYIPHDSFRYTPSSLERICKQFKRIEIKARGTDVTSICAKVIVICARVSSPSRHNVLQMLMLPIIMLYAIPLGIIAIGVGHLSLLFDIGSQDDPLGYTILLEK